MKKMKKFAAIMLMGVMLFGNVLTAQAGCYNHQPEARISYEIQCSYHTHNGKVCQIQDYHKVRGIYCDVCGILIHQYKYYMYQMHVAQ